MKMRMGGSEAIIILLLQRVHASHLQSTWATHGFVTMVMTVYWACLLERRAVLVASVHCPSLMSAECVALGHIPTPQQPQHVLFARLAKLALPTLVLQHALFALWERSRRGWDARKRKVSMQTTMAHAKWWQRALPRATPPFVIMQLTIRCA